MSEVFTITQTENHGIRVDCYDDETADQFDDYMTEVLDMEFDIGAKENVKMFWLGNGFTLDGAAKLVAGFSRYDEEKWGNGSASRIP
jgi:hypothetical protein